MPEHLQLTYKANDVHSNQCGECNYMCLWYTFMANPIAGW